MREFYFKGARKPLVRRVIKVAREGLGTAIRGWGREAAILTAPGFETAWNQIAFVPGWFPEVNAAAFWGVIASEKPKAVVEIGSYLGRSTCLLGLALRQFQSEGRVTAIDPHTGDRQQLERLGLERMPTEQLLHLHLRGIGVEDIVDVHVATSNEMASTWEAPIDLLYIDGWHSYDAVQNDALNFGQHLTDHGLVCFDDYGNYPDVRRAVDDSCGALRLAFYGVVGGQAWAGRPPQAPAVLQRVINATRLIQLRA